MARRRAWSGSMRRKRRARNKRYFDAHVQSSMDKCARSGDAPGVPAPILAGHDELRKPKQVLRVVREDKTRITIEQYEGKLPKVTLPREMRNAVGTGIKSGSKVTNVRLYSEKPRYMHGTKPGRSERSLR